MPEITDIELELLEAYKKLGEPEQVSEAIIERNSIKRKSAVEMAAQLCGFKPNVLDRLAKDLDVSIRDDKAYIKDGDKESLLEDYADDNWSDFMPSLKAEENPKEKGVQYITQSANGRSARKDTKKATTDYIKQKYGWVLESKAVN